MRFFVRVRRNGFFRTADSVCDFERNDAENGRDRSRDEPRENYRAVVLRAVSDHERYDGHRKNLNRCGSENEKKFRGGGRVRLFEFFARFYAERGGDSAESEHVCRKIERYVFGCFVARFAEQKADGASECFCHCRGKSRRFENSVKSRPDRIYGDERKHEGERFVCARQHCGERGVG